MDKDNVVKFPKQEETKVDSKTAAILAHLAKEKLKELNKDE